MDSGTTLIAAQSCGRACLGMVIDPIQVDVAVRRWQAFTGQAATPKGDAMTFDEIPDSNDFANIDTWDS